MAARILSFRGGAERAGAAAAQIGAGGGEFALRVVVEVRRAHALGRQMRQGRAAGFALPGQALGPRGGEGIVVQRAELLQPRDHAGNRGFGAPRGGGDLRIVVSAAVCVRAQRSSRRASTRAIPASLAA